jgi:hypothetical protein
MNRIVGLVSSLFTAFLFSSALMAQADVAVVVNWPTTAGEAPHVVRMTDSSGQTWVLVDRAEHTVKLVNFPGAWIFNISPTGEKRSSISVNHGAATGFKILITGYSGEEKLSEAVLDAPGESAELMLTRCSIEVVGAI